MSETMNYKLHLTKENNERFQDWRNAMNGPDDSNMVKIDTALGEKANKSISVQTVLLSGGWSDCMQTISITGLGETQNGMIAVHCSATPEQREAARLAMLFIAGQEDGALTIAVDGDLPQCDIPVSITLLD